MLFRCALAWWLRTPVQPSTPAARCCSLDQVPGSDFTSQYAIAASAFEARDYARIEAAINRASPVRARLGALERLGQAAAGGGGDGLGQGVEREEAGVQELARAGRADLAPGFDAVDQHVIAAEGALVGVGREQNRTLGRIDTGLLAQLSCCGLFARLAAVDAAAGQMPAVQIGVLDQQHAA